MLETLFPQDTLVTDLKIDQKNELLGDIYSAIHSRLDEKSLLINHIITEERFYFKVAGYIISGKPDWYDTVTHSVEDYKVTSVWKILKGDYKDWIFSQNGYKLMLNENNLPVEKLQINAILKDWKKFEYNQKRDENYPPHSFAVIDLPMMKPLDILIEIANRIKDHESVKNSQTPESIFALRPCTNEEKWHDGDSYAVKKIGGKRAVTGGVFDNKETAELFLRSRDDRHELEVETRLGADRRCDEYCLVKDFCAQYRAEHSTEVVIEKSDPNLLKEFLNE